MWTSRQRGRRGNPDERNVGTRYSLSLVQNNKWPYGPARLGRLPVKEEIAGSNPVRVAIPGGAQQAWEQIGL